jgi:hypothetical protein
MAHHNNLIYVIKRRKHWDVQLLFEMCLDIKYRLFNQMQWK